MCFSTSVDCKLKNYPTAPRLERKYNTNDYLSYMCYLQFPVDDSPFWGLNSTEEHCTTDSSSDILFHGSLE